MNLSTRTIVYFLLSIIVTYAFIATNPVYNTFKFQALAFCIAGTVWGIQLVGAFVYLKDKKFIFLSNAGLVCVSGSVILLISVGINYFLHPSSSLALKISAANVLVSVLVMTVLFARFLKREQMSYNWVIVWLGCLCIAVPLQAKLVGLW